jgi:hypothetical protein
MDEPVQCRLTADGVWEHRTAAGWHPTPWRDFCAWEHVWRWFLAQGKTAERVKEAPKLEVLQ